MLTAVLCAAALALLASRRPPGRRLQHVLPPVPVPAGQNRSWTALSLPLCCLAGLALAIAFGGLHGVVIGLALALLGPRLLAHLEAQAAVESADDLDLPLALDLLAACLAGGATPAAAVSAVAGSTAGSLGARLAQVASALSLGLPPTEAFGALGEQGAAGAAARTLRRAIEGGTPVAAAVARVAEEARHAEAVAAHARAKRLSVTSIAPLVGCFLPAFFLVGVVPALVGAFDTAFRELA